MIAVVLFNRDYQRSDRRGGNLSGDIDFKMIGLSNIIYKYISRPWTASCYVTIHTEREISCDGEKLRWKH